MTAKLRLLDFDRARRASRSRCTDLVPLPTDECLSCGGPVVESSVGEPALFRHGGYGATRETTWQLCTSPDCLAVRFVRVTEVRP